MEITVDKAIKKWQGLLVIMMIIMGITWVGGLVIFNYFSVSGKRGFLTYNHPRGEERIDITRIRYKQTKISQTLCFVSRAE